MLKHDSLISDRSTVNAGMYFAWCYLFGIGYACGVKDYSISLIIVIFGVLVAITTIIQSLRDRVNDNDKSST